MPKVVDPQERRNAIADALFAILRDGGYSAVSLATVADRAGLAIGSVRHFLGSREEMLRFAFDTITDRVGDRVSARANVVLARLAEGTVSTDKRLEATADILGEFLPLDQTRRDEGIVWIEFETAARTNPQLAATSQRAARQVRKLMHTILESAHRAEALPHDSDLDLEAARLSALVDGLTVRAALHPDILSPATARQVIKSHLLGLRRSAD